MPDLAANRADVLGPVDFVVVEFPDGTPSAGGFDQLLDLADRGVISVLDVEFLRHEPDGVRTIPVSELDAGFDLGVWDGASSGLLDAEDLASIGEEMTPGAVAVVVIFENLWVLGLASAWAEGGGRLILDGGLPVDDLVAALDAAESD